MERTCGPGVEVTRASISGRLIQIQETGLHRCQPMQSVGCQRSGPDPLRRNVWRNQNASLRTRDANPL